MVFPFPALMKIQLPVFSLSKANIIELHLVYNSILEYLLIGQSRKYID